MQLITQKALSQNRYYHHDRIQSKTTASCQSHEATKAIQRNCLYSPDVNGEDLDPSRKYKKKMQITNAIKNLYKTISYICYCGAHALHSLLDAYLHSILIPSYT